jgi:hypothetical protein
VGFGDLELVSVLLTFMWYFYELRVSLGSFHAFDWLCEGNTMLSYRRDKSRGELYGN